MTQYMYDKNELERDLVSSEPEILRNDLPFEMGMSSCSYGMYEAVAIGNDDPFTGE